MEAAQFTQFVALLCGNGRLFTNSFDQFKRSHVYIQSS